MGYTDLTKYFHLNFAVIYQNKINYHNTSSLLGYLLSKNLKRTHNKLINSMNDEEGNNIPMEMPGTLEIPSIFTSATSSLITFVDHHKAENPGRMN